MSNRRLSREQAQPPAVNGFMRNIFGTVGHFIFWIYLKHLFLGLLHLFINIVENTAFLLILAFTPTENLDKTAQPALRAGDAALSAAQYLRYAITTLRNTYSTRSNAPKAFGLPRRGRAYANTASR